MTQQLHGERHAGAWRRRVGPTRLLAWFAGLGWMLAAASPVAAQADSLAQVARAAAAGPAATAEIDRGRYLVVIAQCNNCHTSGYSASQGTLPEAQWLLGDARGRREPDGGTVYATNLRHFVAPLSAPQWLAVVRGSRARAPMPWWNLRAMAEADLLAVYAYIRSLQPTGEPAPAYRPPGP